ncbi:hypothetical protein HELRODRAFT_179243 [Helobdella robusta]|uniref:Uncharacterized protein n=1 Tax=Helobdella robusta TaxID=6412 RepID=T1FEF1_HELRO|nr:hypothetical protein HELRODRAFT_179243 [Helobdella robusta]ESN95474.1 hypothetical protein HELRODRAFT_179243 [Helobdella robusta]
MFQLEIIYVFILFKYNFAVQQAVTTCPAWCHGNQCALESCWIDILDDQHPEIRNISYLMPMLHIDGCKIEEIPQNLFASVTILNTMYVVDCDDFNNKFWTDEQFIAPLSEILYGLMVDGPSVPTAGYNENILKDFTQLSNIYFGAEVTNVEFLKYLKNVKRLHFSATSSDVYEKCLAMENLHETLTTLSILLGKALTLEAEKFKKFKNLKSIQVVGSPSKIHKNIVKILDRVNITFVDDKLARDYFEELKKLNKTSTEQIISNTSKPRPKTNERERNFSESPTFLNDFPKVLNLQVNYLNESKLVVSCQVTGGSQLKVYIVFPNGTKLIFSLSYEDDLNSIVHYEEYSEYNKVRGYYTCQNTLHQQRVDFVWARETIQTNE